MSIKNPETQPSPLEAAGTDNKTQVEIVSSEKFEPPAPVPEVVIPEAVPLFDPDSIGGAGDTSPDTCLSMPVPGEKPETRGRPKKYATVEEAEAAKKERDRLRRGGSEKKIFPAQSVAPSLTHLASAAAIVGTVDMVLTAVSSGEYSADNSLRSSYTEAWAKYLEQTGKEPPPWVMVLLMSGAYAAPAFATRAGQSKLTTVVNKIKAMWVRRFG